MRDQEPAWRRIVSRGAMLLFGLLLVGAGIAVFFLEAVADSVVATSVGAIMACIGLFVFVWGLVPSSRYEAIGKRFGAIIDNL